MEAKRKDLSCFGPRVYLYCNFQEASLSFRNVPEKRVVLLSKTMICIIDGRPLRSVYLQKFLQVIIQSNSKNIDLEDRRLIVQKCISDSHSPPRAMACCIQDHFLKIYLDAQVYQSPLYATWGRPRFYDNFIEIKFFVIFL